MSDELNPASVRRGRSAAEVVTGYGTRRERQAPTCCATASGDPDADGVTTLNEYLAATDPTRAASILRLLTPVRGAGLTTLRFPHTAVRSHAALFREDFGSWFPLTHAPLFQIGTQLMEVTTDAAGAVKRFYHARATSMESTPARADPDGVQGGYTVRGNLSWVRGPG
jgi:hypothetical protein